MHGSNILKIRMVYPNQKKKNLRAELVVVVILNTRWQSNRPRIQT